MRQRLAADGDVGELVHELVAQRRLIGHAIASLDVVFDDRAVDDQAVLVKHRL